MKALASLLAALAMVLSCSAAPSTPEGLLLHLPTNAPARWKGPTNGFGIPSRMAELHWWSPVKERVVTFYAEPHGKAPELMAVMIDSELAQVELRKRQEEWQAEYRTNRGLMLNKLFPVAQAGDLPDFNKAKWIPFKTNLTVDLGREMASLVVGGLQEPGRCQP